MEMTLSHLYLETKIVALEKHGYSRERALDVVGLGDADLARHIDRMAVDQFLALLCDASQVLGDDHIGLRLGHGFRVSTFAQTGNVYGYAKCLKDVIELNGRYQPLAIDAGEISYVQEEDGAHFMRLRPYYDDQEKYRHITDAIMGAYVTAYRWLSWSSGADIAAMRLPYDAPTDTTFHEEVFRCPVEFGREAVCLEFPQSAMDQILPTHDAEKLSRAKARLDQLLGSSDAQASLDSAVEAAIRGAIESGHVTSHIVADRMGRSWSTLRKDLKATDRGFRDRLDRVRQSLFIEMQAERMSFAQISQALAYNDQPAFNRAFKRWYGVSPTQWSAQQDA